METFVLRWTKDNLPFWQGVDDGEKIEINAVADVINENAILKRENDELRDGLEQIRTMRLMMPLANVVPVIDALLTKETNDGN